MPTSYGRRRYLPDLCDSPGDASSGSITGDECKSSEACGASAAETWADWIGQGTKVINELRLDLSSEESQDTYDRHMYEFLGIDDELLAQLQSSSS